MAHALVAPGGQERITERMWRVAIRHVFITDREASTLRAEEDAWHRAEWERFDCKRQQGSQAQSGAPTQVMTNGDQRELSMRQAASDSECKLYADADVHEHDFARREVQDTLKQNS